MRAFCYAIVLLATTTATGDVATRDEWGQPVLVLDTYLGFFGHDVVHFALYSTGRVVFANRDLRLMTVALSPSERTRLLSGLRLDAVGDLPPPRNRDVADDATFDCIHVWANGTHRVSCSEDSFAARRSRAIAPIWRRLASFTSRTSHPLPLPRPPQQNMWLGTTSR